MNSFAFTSCIFRVAYLTAGDLDRLCPPTLAPTPVRSTAHTVGFGESDGVAIVIVLLVLVVLAFSQNLSLL
jgi:hypothetical protein